MNCISKYLNPLILLTYVCVIILTNVKISNQYIGKMDH